MSLLLLFAGGGVAAPAVQYPVRVTDSSGPRYGVGDHSGVRYRAEDTSDPRYVVKDRSLPP